MMKKIFSLLTLLMIAMVGWTQTAQNPKLSYQAVVRDNSNKLVTNSNIDVTISVLRMDNSLQYTQSFTAVPTNRNGLISLLIGGEADWDDIDWLHSKIAVAITLPDLSVVKDTTEVNAVPLAINTVHSTTVDPSALVQSDWTQEDTEDPSFIKNKPSISDTVNTILTTEGYVTATTLDGRHYLTSDSAVITTMQHDIANLTLHTTQHAIRDSVAGQIHDSISNISAASHTHNNKALLDTYTQTEADLADAVVKKHTHENQDVLDRIDRAYSETDSAKLAGISAGAEVNVQADWNQNTTTADDYIKNKPTIPTIPTNVSAFTNDAGYLTTDAIDSLQNVQADWNQTSTTAKDYIKNKPTIPTIPTNVSAFTNDAGYLTKDSAVITTMQHDITANENNIANLTLHTTRHAIRDSVAGQIHDSIAAIPSFIEQQVLSISNDTIYLTGGSYVKLPAGFSGNYNDLTHKPTIPTTVAQLTDAANYLTTGAIDSLQNVQADWNQNTTTADDYIKNKPTIPTIPTNVSAFTNDAGYLTKDSAVITTMQHDITANENNIANLTLHTTRHAIRDSVAGQIHDSISNMSAASHTHNNKALLDTYTQTEADLADAVDKKHTHENQDVLDRIDRAYSETDSAKLAGIAEGAEVNVQADWNQNSTTADDYIKNKPTIPTIPTNVSAFTNDAGYLTTGAIDSLQNVQADWNQTSTTAKDYIKNKPSLFSGDYNDLTNKPSISDTVNGLLDTKGYLTSTSDVITTLQSDLSAAIGKEKTDSTTLATRIDALENAQMDCNKVKDCIKDTLSQYVTADLLCNAVKDCDFSNNTSIATLLQGLSSQISSLQEQVAAQNRKIDSLSNLPHGGDTPTDTFKCGTYKVKDVQDNEYPTVQIGSQCWMAQNLRTDVGNGVYPKKNSGSDDLDAAEQVIYGRLYTWDAVTKGASTTYPKNATDTLVHGICPAGWHVPSDAEWDTLTCYVFNSASPDYKCGDNCGAWQAQSNVNCIAKALSDTTGWNSNTSSGCNAGNSGEKSNLTGFTAVPAGGRPFGNLEDFGSYAYFWSATEGEDSKYYAWRRFLSSYVSYVDRDDDNKDYGFSVRCLRDAGIGGTPGENETGGTTPSTPATMSCDDVMQCLGDTLGKLNARITSQGAEIEELNATVTEQGQTIETLNGTVESQGETISAQGQTITAQGNTIDSLAHIVDSLSRLPHGGTGAFTCGSTVTDHQGNVYNTLQIGNQCWTKENMRCTTSPITGASILVNPADATSSGKKAFCYDNDPANADNGYGLLYNWYAAVDTFYTGEISEIELSGHHRGICPKGWHVPSVREWTDLTSFVKSQPDYRCGETEWDIAKALASKTGWNQDEVAIHECSVGNNSEDNNATGFSALPAGYYHQSNGFVGRGDSALFWSSTSYNSYYTRDLQLSYVDGGVMENQYSSVNHGLSVRCVWDGGAGGDNTCCSELGARLDSLENVVDSLANLINNGGGDTTEVADGQPCPGAATVSDADGNTYNTVKIGSQCWTKENLRTKLGTAGDYGYPTGAGNDTVTYGRLYAWTAMMNGAQSTDYPNGSAPKDTMVRGICPEGWHVPSDAEWDMLTTYVNSIAEYRCGGANNYIANALSASTGWTDTVACCAGYSSATINKTGFSAVPAGKYYSEFDFFGNGAFFWSATENGGSALRRRLFCQYTDVDGYQENKNAGLSVRCLRD